MESDFSIRKEVDGLDSGDPSLRELLNNYKFPPKGNAPAPAAGFGGFAGGGSNDMYLGNMIGQLQGSVERLAREREAKRSGFGGLQLNIDPEVLKWIIVLAVILIIIWIFMRGEKTSRRKKNPLNRRLKSLERQVKILAKSKSKRSLPDFDDDDDDDLV